MPQSQEPPKDAWRVLLFARNGSELLLLKRSSGLCLPELRIPRSQRVAPNLNAEARRVWKLDTVCLSPFEVSPSPCGNGHPNYHLMEVRKPEELARVAPNFVDLCTLREDSFADARDYAIVRQAMGVDGTVYKEDSGGPFSQFGAFESISAWVEEQLRPLGLSWNGSFRQLQADTSFALIRFSTSRSAVWFKAVGEPNLREFPITRLLASRLPQYVPELLATRPDWNGWLAEEAQGQGLFESSDPTTWCKTAESLADLQIASLHHPRDLIAAGAHDVRARTLSSVLIGFFSVMEEIMQEQTKTTVRKLSVQEIGTVRDHMAAALDEFEHTGVPDALNHLDLNPCNVVVSSNQCKFLDWAEAGVGCPFFSMEYLRQHFLQMCSDTPAGERTFRDAYLERWTSILDIATAERLMRLAPLTATYAFAASALPWKNPQLRRLPELAAYFRSLVRRMYRESERLSAD